MLKKIKYQKQIWNVLAGSFGFSTLILYVQFEYENDFKQCLLIIKYKTSQLKRSYNL